MPIFGETTRGGDTFPVSDDRALVTRFSLSEDADVTEVAMWFATDSTAGSFAKFIVHNDNAAEPGTREYVSAAAAIPAGGGLVTWAVGPGELTLQPGNYWLGLVATNFTGRHNQINGSGVTRMMNGSYSYSSPPADWDRPGDIDYDNTLSAYVTYDVGGGGGDNTGTGSVTMDDATVAGTGATTQVGAGDASMDDATADGSGATTNIGAGDASMDDATADGTGMAAHAGDGAVTMDDAAASGAGATTNIGAGDASMDDAAASGAGATTNIAAGDASMDDLTAYGSSDSQRGSGSVVMDDATASGSGAQHGEIHGDGSVNLDDSAVVGEGTTTNVAEGTVVAGEASVSAFGGSYVGGNSELTIFIGADVDVIEIRDDITTILI